MRKIDRVVVDYATIPRDAEKETTEAAKDMAIALPSPTSADVCSRTAARET